MSFRSVIIGILALTFGGSAAVGVNLLYRQHGQAAADEPVQIIVAHNDIPAGAVIAPEKINDNKSAALMPEPADRHIPPARPATLNEHQFDQQLALLKQLTQFMQALEKWKAPESATASDPKPQRPVMESAAPQPVFAEIRTLRGLTSGVVRVETAPPAKGR